MKSSKDDLLKNLHKFARKDPFIISIFQSAGIQLDKLVEKLELLEKEFLFSTMSWDRIKQLEEEMNYRTKTKTIEGKRLEIEARWKTSRKCDTELLQLIAETWRNGTVTVSFEKSIIKLKFNSLVGIPDDLEVLKFSISEAKPAHLPIEFSFNYRVWNHLKKYTWDELNSYTWDELRDKEGL